MKLLFVGDVVGRPGRRILADQLPRLVDHHRADYVIVNIENAAGGNGITHKVFAELDELPIDCYTTGNHVWDKKDVLDILRQEPRLLRPHNYPAANPGRGVYVGRTPAGIPVATLNLQGRVFMQALDNPFAAAEELLADLEPEVKVVFVDFHADATSEKQAMGWHLDGRASAVIGTHTHVPTADERILPGGTAFLTDVGMTGPYESVIGVRADRVLPRFLYQTPTSFDVAKRDVRLAAVVVEVDEESGKATGIERLLLAERQP
jgi:metallophosphoesterase (TIGR00282 family)